MNTPDNVTLILNEQLIQLRNRRLPPDAALEAASQITDTGSALANELEEQGRFQEAAELYDKIAVSWKEAIAVLTGERQRSFQSLAEYWAERAAAAQRRAAESARQAASPPPGAAINSPNPVSIQSNRPITRPLGRGEAQSDKGIVTSKSPAGLTAQTKTGKTKFTR